MSRKACSHLSYLSMFLRHSLYSLLIINMSELPKIVTINFVHPSTFMISGPTQCGKTSFVVRVLKEGMIRDANGRVPNKIFWLYGAKQPDLFKPLKEQYGTNISFKKGLDESIMEKIDPNDVNLVVIDDLMPQAKNSSFVEELYTTNSHHQKISVIYLVQNLFPQGKNQVSISRNTHYVILFKNPRYFREPRLLASQMLASNEAGNFEKMFGHVTAEAFHYLVMDLRNDTSAQFRFRTHIFPGEGTLLFDVRQVVPDEDDDMSSI